MVKVVEAVYENGVFKPLQKVDLKNGERVKIEIGNEIFGILRGWRIDPQKLKDELRDIHG